MWKYTVELERPQMTIWSMRIVCWLLKATNTCSQYVIIIAFPLQQWLHEYAAVLCYTYICLSCLNVLTSTTHLDLSLQQYLTLSQETTTCKHYYTLDFNLLTF